MKTKFTGSFSLNRKLTMTLFSFLNSFTSIRVARQNLDNKVYGYLGEFDVNNAGEFWSTIDSKPLTQPNQFCAWRPTKDGYGIEWDGMESFTDYGEWLSYIINKILIPNHYILNGEVTWEGEGKHDFGKIIVNDNIVNIRYQMNASYELPIDMSMRLDYVYIDNDSQPKKKKTKKDLEAIIADQAYQITKLKQLLNERNN